MRPYNYIVYDKEEGILYDEGVLLADGEKNAEYKAIEKAQAEGDDFDLSDPSLVVKVVPFG